MDRSGSMKEILEICGKEDLIKNYKGNEFTIYKKKWLITTVVPNGYLIAFDLKKGFFKHVFHYRDMSNEIDDYTFLNKLSFLNKYDNIIVYVYEWESSKIVVLYIKNTDKLILFTDEDVLCYNNGKASIISLYGLDLEKREKNWSGNPIYNVYTNLKFIEIIRKYD